MNFFQRIIFAVKADYARACGLAGYIRNRMLEKSTWLALAGAIAAANELKPPYAAASIAIALIMAMLPSPSKIAAE